MFTLAWIIVHSMLPFILFFNALTGMYKPAMFKGDGSIINQESG